MTEAYTARASTREQIKIAIRTIQLDTNASGQYKHDDVLVFIKGVTRSLGELYNEADPGNGMKKLLDESSNGTNAIRSMDNVTVETVLAESKAATLSISPATLPTITTRQDAQEAADRQNIRNQAVIGAKEGTAAAITEKVGSDVTDLTLRSSDGLDLKSIDDYQLSDLVAAIISGADRPPTTEVLDQLIAVMGFEFDHKKKVIANVEALRARAAKIETYGITIGEAQLALIILANIETAAQHDYGREFRPAMQNIRRQYTYNHRHDSTSIAYIMQELGIADRARILSDAPASNELNGRGAAHSVSEQMTILKDLLTDDASTAYGSAYSAAAGYSSSDSETSREKARREKYEASKTTRRRTPRRSSQTTPKKGASIGVKHAPNDCPSCKKFQRKKPHPHIEEERCFFNVKYKGYRAKWICDEME